MTVYLDELFALNTALNYLLLAGSARLGGGALRRRRLLAAAALGGVYAAAALVPELRFLRAGGMKAAAAALMLVLVIFGYVQLFEATTKVGALESQLKTLTQQQTLLESKYESKIDLKVVRERAEKLGMSMPKEEQVVYIRLAGTDRAEIYEEEKTNIVGEIVQAVQESISNLIAYLRPTAA